MIKRIRIGTRESNLALWQANYVKTIINEHFPQIEIVFQYIKTQGDIDQVSSLTKVGGEGIFTKAIEKALIENKIDIAVHSLKDLPTILPDMLKLSAVMKRGSVADVFIGSEIKDFHSLRDDATIACGSVRRRSQLLALKPDLNIVDLRGNIETRLSKLKRPGIDGIIMAEAALLRLNLKDIAYYRFRIDEMLPAVSQGAVGLETRIDDHDLLQLLEKVNDPDTYSSVSAERTFLNKLDSGCQFPVAAYAEIDNDLMTFSGLVASKNGKKVLKETHRDDKHKANQIAVTIAEKLIKQGALELLSED